ncbi:MAG: ABC transporter substrate-binding protein [Clostridium sp.]|nr:ABC transporter substrate-binding protein [Clostridium sp.]
MKKTKSFAVIIIFVLLIGVFSACSSKDEDVKLEKLVVGASPSPHAEILENIKEDLKEDGYDLEIKIFTDYIIPNKALNEKSLDANFFQHQPYLEQMNADLDLGLTYTVKVHIEPMGLYSNKIDDVNDIEDGFKVSIPNDQTNGSRALKLLADNGIIKLADKELVSKYDITENKYNLDITELDAASLPRTLDDVDMSIINTNYAYEADLNPLEDSIIIEAKDSPYANLVAVREDNKDEDKIKALSKHLTSDKTKKFIEEKYKDAIIPAF